MYRLDPPAGWCNTILFVLLLPLLVLVLFALLPGAALAAGDLPPDSKQLVLPQTQLIAAIVGALVPLVTYFLNHYAPWVSEPAKALFLVLVAAGGGALTTLLDAGGIPLTWETAQVVGTAVVLAFLAHAGFWRPSGLSVRLKGGTNRRGQPAPS